eukprot:CAMPEP_0176262774 /NCGR_PEP_ID=MMETSP0121_2-20121125/40785_1 /TAXON_ID=160619 /ORGANISM="Kryptoperidinium foliaceum, Strain CCMP 1326" /LENGTH=36 /DNA_ID= /DNA_START= /DNA_END= /DNA_ORIENTATION=
MPSSSRPTSWSSASTWSKGYLALYASRTSANMHSSL